MYISSLEISLFNGLQQIHPVGEAILQAGRECPMKGVRGRGAVCPDCSPADSRLFCLIHSFFAESFVNKESMCNFAAQFNREIF